MAALKVGIIGVGGIARTHVPGWRDSEHAELVAGSDLDAEALKTWGEANDVKTLHADSKDLIADPDIDIVDICTPNMSHVPLTIAALEAGKHVICEKPLAPTPDGVREMIAARDKSGKTLMTAQHFRFNSSARALKAVYGRIIKPFEFDPFAHEAVKPHGDRHRLVIDEAVDRQAGESSLTRLVRLPRTRLGKRENAQAESTIGLFKTEAIKFLGPWK